VADAVTPAEPYEGRDATDFVRRIVLPRDAPITSRDESFPVLLEGPLDQRLRQASLPAARRQRDGRRRGIEVAELGGAGNEIDAVSFHRGLDRGMEVGAHLVTRCQIGR